MDAHGAICPIVATPSAKATLNRLRDKHGPIILHVTGGCCDARTPLCLPAGELRLGARDILLGTVEDVPVYEMQSTPEVCYCCGCYLLDMAPGVPVGFSLDVGDGLRFSIREVAPSEGSQPARAGQTYSGGSV